MTDPKVGDSVVITKWSNNIAVATITKINKSSLTVTLKMGDKEMVATYMSNRYNWWSVRFYDGKTPSFLKFSELRMLKDFETAEGVSFLIEIEKEKSQKKDEEVRAFKNQEAQDKKLAYEKARDKYWAEAGEDLFDKAPGVPTVAGTMYVFNKETEDKKIVINVIAEYVKDDFDYDYKTENRPQNTIMKAGVGSITRYKTEGLGFSSSSWSEFRVESMADIVYQLFGK